MTKKTVKFDPLDFFETKEDIADLLQDAFNSQDPKYIARAIGIAAKAKGMANIASQSNLNREQLYKTFSDKGNPTLSTMVSVLTCLGYKLNIKPL